MEGNLSSGHLISGSGGAFDLQSSMRIHHQQTNPFTLHQSAIPQGSMIHPSVHNTFPLRIETIQDCNPHNQTISLAEFAKGERGKCSLTDEDEPSNDEARGKNVSPWHRVKWNDTMVRILITAVSYIGEDASMEYGSGSRRKISNLQKKGKWKLVSKVMAERGHIVSPQQCEDKFNDLNKRYKRLNEILGRGTSCEVVENPSLLELMDHVSEKLKEEVRKILSSKHLYYEEMCSYHNGNRLHLPPDPELQRSLRLALRPRDDNDERRLDDDDQDHHYMDDHVEYDDGHQHHHHHGVGEGSSKRVKVDEACQMKAVQTEMNQEGLKANVLQDQWMKHRLMQLEDYTWTGGSRSSMLGVAYAEMLKRKRERESWWLNLKMN
ncbi:uncharacterized protein LOC143610394 [Bidens hawaiensis]|uniref:uncharacterized protein LOC143610394 n=1 Tax=Bidens hawaiensis TaxID=980011 RepID=UPI00404B4529